MRRSFVIVGAVIVVAAVAAATLGIAGVHRSTRDSGPEPREKLRFGVAVSGADSSLPALDALATSVGESPSLVMAYFDFRQPPPVAMLTRLAARGQTLVITWEPWQWGGGGAQPDFRTARITAGDFDDYLSVWARALAASGHPVYLRLGQEMNQANYPWADLANGNHIGDFAAAWRHVHDLFVREGATRVSWVWSPNVPDRSSEPMADAYPGSHYVDDVALDGYNWGSTQSWSHWVAPSTLFDSGLADLRRIAPGIPVMIGETGSAERGGDKAAWSRQLIAYLSRQPDVVGFIMFNQNKETDWRIDSSPGALAAFASALRDRGASSGSEDSDNGG